jgi:hypothetical protein
VVEQASEKNICNHTRMSHQKQLISFLLSLTTSQGMKKWGDEENINNNDRPHKF